MTFGFDPATYMINESEQRVVFNVTLVSGVLVRDIEIEFFTEDGSAIGMYMFSATNASYCNEIHHLVI